MSTNQNANYLMQRAIAAGITDPAGLANFMGQMQVESSGFSRMEESLHYSGSRLLTVFHGRNGIDNITEAERIAAGGPESVADAVYGGHFGLEKLGNTELGDGYKYHGRGFVQLTGRYRYTEYSRLTGLDLVHHPELASERDNAATIAIAYWKEQVVKNHAETSVRDATYYINNGYNGLADRRTAVAEWEQRLQHGNLAGLAQAADSNAHGAHDAVRGAERHPTILHEGSHGEVVTALQTELATLGYTDSHGRALPADGDFGRDTLHAVEAFQRDHGLTANGQVDPRTQAVIQTVVDARKMEASVVCDAPAPLMTFSNPAHPQHEMYAYLKGILPAASEERFCQATAACHVAGINKPEDLSAVHITDTKALFCSDSLFANMAVIDLAKPIPTVQQSLQQVQQFDQQQQLQTQQTLQQQPTQAPVMHR